jgi:hypothetical protein
MAVHQDPQGATLSIIQYSLSCRQCSGRAELRR